MTIDDRWDVLEIHFEIKEEGKLKYNDCNREFQLSAEEREALALRPELISFGEKRVLYKKVRERAEVKPGRSMLHLKYRLYKEK